MPHFVLNLEQRFTEAVVKPFVASYLEGKTPIPCTVCNTEVKFKTLLQKAAALGCEAVATGHYARIGADEVTGAPRLLRARDRSRDQSYFLYDLTEEQLARARFPLGELTKPEVREIAREAGLPNWDKPDSQEDLLRAERDRRRRTSSGRRLPRLGLDLPAIGGARAGEILLEGGERVGAHEGTFGYTIGQRRGLGVASKEPLYVIATSPEDSRVVVGPAPSLLSKKILLEGVSVRMAGGASVARARARAHPLAPSRAGRLAHARGRTAADDSNSRSRSALRRPASRPSSTTSPGPRSSSAAASSHGPLA